MRGQAPAPERSPPAKHQPPRRRRRTSRANANTRRPYGGAAGFAARFEKIGVLYQQYHAISVEIFSIELL
jgi:hypothetical protein